MKAWKLSIILSGVLSLVSCSSTPNLSPGNPLPGIGLGASKNTVLLSWTKDGVLARQLRPRTRLNILASYNTEYGPVHNEVISTKLVEPGFTGLKFDLPETLRLPPLDNVCLRLAVGRKAIPIRIARINESIDGFYYDEWAQKTKASSKEADIKSSLSIVNQNIKNFSATDSNFESWRKENNLSSINDCKTLATTISYDRPPTALKGKAKTVATAQQCVYLYEQTVRNPRRFTKEKNLAFSNIDGMIKATKTSSRHSTLAKQMQNDFANHSPGKEFFIGSSLPLNSAPLKSRSSVKKNGEISEIAARILVEAYEGCKIEAENRFSASFRNWKEVTAATTVSAREEPMRKLCRARFTSQSTRLNRLNELIQKKNEIEAEYQEYATEKSAQLPDKKLLIPYACPATN